MQDNWFETWFDTKHYHILYGNRDEKEAQLFINKLLDYLNLNTNCKLLDIACGKGRHALQMHQRGYDVTAYDLSNNSIEAAKEYQNEQLNFYVHDMRKLFWTNYFDAAFNLFTSFGYFETELDEMNALKSASKSLKKGGLLVMDFLNSKKVVKNLVSEENKTIDGIEFKISRSIENKKVCKTISFVSDGKAQQYTEKVKLLELSDFQQYFSQVGLKLKQSFGSYQLEEFNENSDRLILIAEKS